MKKITLLMAAMTASVMSFAALNPFAYGLSSELNAGETNLTVKYALNDDATTVKVVIMNGETAVKTIDCKGITKGEYTEVIPTEGLPKGVELTWKVEVTGAEVTAVVEGKNYGLYHPASVDIDLNPESEYFGRIICTEGMNNAKTRTDGKYISQGFGAGIFAFTPSFEQIKNGDKPGFNGGIEFQNTNTAGKAYAPRRVRISKDGRIFLTSMEINGTYLWELNPDNLDEWTPMFEYAKMNDKAEIFDADSNFIAGPNSGFDVRGEGENLQLLMLSANTAGFAFAASGYKCSEYNLGTATTWNKPRTRAIFDGKYGVSHIGAQVQYDADGGVWFISNRATATEQEPGLVHFNAQGVEDYKELRNNTNNAGFRFNHDFSKVIVATAEKAVIYAVSKSEDGKPVLTEETTIPMATVKRINDFAWDYANNIYALSNNTEKFAVYSLPHTADAVVATPAATKYAFTLDGTGTYVDNTAAEAAVTEKVVRNGQVLIIRDGKTYNTMGQIVE